MTVKELTIDQIIRRAIEDGLTLEIDYSKDGSKNTSRVISQIALSDKYGLEYISAHCNKRNEQRFFKISRILDAKIIGAKFNANKPIFSLYGEKY